MPLQFTRESSSHGRLESPQLSDRLQVVDSIDCLGEIISVGVSMDRFLVDGFKKNRILLQMLRRSVEVMLQIETHSFSRPCSLTRGMLWITV